MAPASSSLLPDSSRFKWKKRKRESNLNAKKQQKEDDGDDEDDDEEPNAGQPEDDDTYLLSNSRADPVLDLRESEVLSDGGQRISDFPPLVRRSVNRPHRSVLGIVFAERCADGHGNIQVRPFIENISHGQLQVLSAVLPDHPFLNDLSDVEKQPPAYICTPPPLMEGKGVAKRFGTEGVLVLPTHSDWFSLSTVHRLERQAVPHFFAGKSKNHNPDKYISLRNRVVAKYMDNPERRLSYEECQGIFPGTDLHDLSRIVRFLDHWGIINFLAGSGDPKTHVNTSLVREEPSGEIQLVSGPLKSIDSLVQFDRPRSSCRLEDIPSLHLSASKASGAESPDLDSRIRERLSDFFCSYCLGPLPRIHYQSQKEADTALCSHCFHNGNFIIGHSSLDFVRADLRHDSFDTDGGDNWTNQETFLLLEALEKYPDNWNEIADHVGTKSKAQCILHFVRLPMEEGLLDNLEFPSPICSDDSSGKTDGMLYRSSDGFHEGADRDEGSEKHLPFANAANPVMALVAFLTTSIGPRVAATCANTALTVLTKFDGRADLVNPDGTSMVTYPAVDLTSSGHTKGNSMANKGFHGKIDAADGISIESVKLAANLGLSSAATKAKLFADQEEREIQRLTAIIVNYQLKRLELKLKQFAEIETLLLKECEQVERSRHSILAERMRLLSSRLGQPNSGSAAGAPIAMGPSQMAVSLSVASTASTPIANSNTRHAGMPLGGQSNIPPVGAQASLSTVFGNNIPAHPHMPFMSQQPMFPFVGPRLPLSAIHPPSSHATGVMLPSGMSSGSTTNQHPLLRSMSGNNGMS